MVFFLFHFPRKNSGKKQKIFRNKNLKNRKFKITGKLSKFNTFGIGLTWLFEPLCF